jgi:hypothetical protein
VDEIDMTEGVMVCRLVLPLPKGFCCYGPVSLNHPDMKFEILGCMPIDKEKMVEDVRVQGISDGIIEELQKSWDVKAVEVVKSSKNTVVHRLTLATCPIISIHQDLHLLPTFPFAVKNGVAMILVTASAQKVRELYARLKEQIPGTQITSVRRTYVDGKESMLTPHQLEVFRMALSAGYWDVPRRTTLTDLASITHRAKSTLAETLAMIENKLLHEVSAEHLDRLPF